MSSSPLPMSLSNALAPTLNRLRLRYSQSPLPAFLGWWGGQLRSCLPVRWQAALDTRDAELWLSLEDDLLVVRQGQVDGGETLASIDRGDSTDLVAAFEAALTEELRNRRRILLVPAAQVLRRRLQLPAAAVDNLATVLGFELDRQTPFRPEQVFFDSRVLPHESGARTLPVELALVPREPLQAALAALGPLAAQIDAVDAAAPGGRLGFNFLPPSQRRRRVHGLLWINLGLLAASLLFLLLAMAQLVDNRALAVAQLQAEADAARESARSVASLRKSLEDAVAGANFLAVRKSTQPSIIELLDRLTTALPDDTFLERLNASGTTLSLTGQSARAAQLIERLRSVEGIRDAALSGAIQPDARSGKDRFTISAQIGNASREVGGGAASGR